MKCDIEWNSLSLAAWDKRFETLPRSNILQSYDYACAVCAVDRQRARWGLIRIDGEEAGLVQILEAGVFGNLIHAVILDCGPLWFAEFGSEDHERAFFETFDREFPRRFGRRRRIIPEIQSDMPPVYRWQEGSSYETIWIDLQLEEAELRSNLNRKWRGWLRKAEKAVLTVEWDGNGTALDWLLERHKAHRSQKGYRGASEALLRAMAVTFGQNERMIIGRATYNGVYVAGILLFLHGKAATYQIGWNGGLGREKGAHHMLLWNSMLYLKKRGYKGLDLGGGNKEDAKDVRTFKMGLGGDLVSLPGHYS